MKRKAFSLGETLIAVGVLSVIAATIIPLVVVMVQDRVRASHVELFKKKFSKAMEMMALQGEIGPYYRDTAEFVDYLQSHLKINTICRVGGEPASLPTIEHCFGDDYPGINMPDGTVLPLNTITDGQAFQMPSNSSNDWSTPNIGILTVDGNHIILSWNLHCKSLVAGVYSGDIPSKCVAGVMDIDGIRKPNTLGKDVNVFASANGLGSGCFVKEKGLCLTAPKKITEEPATYEHCMSVYSDLGLSDNHCVDAEYTPNYFVSMAEACGGWSKIASPEDIKKMLDSMYGTSVPVDGGIDTPYIGGAEKFGIPSPAAQTVYIANWTIDCYTQDSDVDTGGKRCMLHGQALTRSGVSSKETDVKNSGTANYYFFCKR